MGRTNQITPTTLVHIRLPVAAVEAVDGYKEPYGKTRTDLILEAIQLWLSTQRRLYGDKIKVVTLLDYQPSKTATVADKEVEGGSRLV